MADRLEPLLAFSKKYKIVTSSYSGLFPILPAANNSVAKAVDAEVRIHISDVASRIAAARGPEVTSNQVIMKWILMKGVFVVTTSSKRSRIEEYLRIDEVKDLTEEEMVQLKEATGGKHLRAFVSKSFLSIIHSDLTTLHCRRSPPSWMSSSNLAAEGRQGPWGLNGV